MPCRLLDDGKNRHFMTKRFDRTSEGKKLHMQSLAAMGHFDFNAAGSTSYEQCFTILNTLGLGHYEKLDMFRRMVFNVMARNQDDHVKNIAFLMDRRGTWSLSPAYDITFALNPENRWLRRHQMSVNGKLEAITREDLIAAGRNMNIRPVRAKAILSEVASALADWPKYAEEAFVTEKTAAAIQAAFQV